MLLLTKDTDSQVKLDLVPRFTAGSRGGDIDGTKPGKDGLQSIGDVLMIAFHR